MKPLVSAVLLSFLLLSPLAPVLRADGITDWNSEMLDAIRNENTSPPLAARNLALLHLALFESVNNILHTHQSYLGFVPVEDGTSPDTAVAAAGHDMLIILYPSRSALADSLYSEELTNLPSGPSTDNGVALGQQMASLVLENRSDDGSSAFVDYIPRTGPGAWQRTPPFFRPPDLPQWPNVTPFVMTNGAQFRPAGPPSLFSDQFVSDFNLVKSLGANTNSTRTADQTQIARFWSDFSSSATPPGHWNEIAQVVASARNNSLADNARLFALLNITMADGGIACWDAKYRYNFWRPVTAIRNADTVGNPALLADTNWTPLLTTPSFPEYMSGHSTFSAASAVVLSNFFGTDAITFSIGSDALPGVYRTYSSFAATAEEIGMSRIYGGIHYLTSDLDGLATGRRLADYVWKSVLRPLPPHLEITPTAQASGGWKVMFSGATTNLWVLEFSSDLRTWTPLRTNVPPLTVMTSTNPVFSGGFYRARMFQ